MTQATWSGANRDNIRSFWWGYDALDRLIKSDMGHLDETTNPPIAASGPLPLRSDWTLDRLENWTGDSTHAGNVNDFSCFLISIGVCRRRFLRQLQRLHHASHPQRERLRLFPESLCRRVLLSGPSNRMRTLDIQPGRNRAVLFGSSRFASANPA